MAFCKRDRAVELGSAVTKQHQLAVSAGLESEKSGRLYFWRQNHSSIAPKIMDLHVGEITVGKGRYIKTKDNSD